MLRVALRSILARKRRLFSTGFAIVLAVAFVAGTLVITALINSSLSTLIGSNLAGIDAVVRSSSSQESPFGPPVRPTVDPSLVDLTAKVKGVADAEPMVQGFPTLIDKEGDRIQVAFGPPTFALSWIENDALRGTRLLEGSRAPERAGEAVLSEHTAAKHGFEVGDEIQVAFSEGTYSFTLVGLDGIYDERGNLVSGPDFISIGLEEAMSVMGKSGYDLVLLEAADGVSQVEVANNVAMILSPEVEVLTGADYTDETQAAISDIVGLFTKPILAFGFIAVFVGVFVIYNTFSIIVAQRTRELALLRAVGASRKQILGSVLVEAVVIGVVASFVGVGLGWLLAVGLKGALSASFELPPGVPGLPASAVAVGVAVGLASPIVSALIPAARATTIPPVAAFGHVAVDRSNLSRARAVVGTVLFAVGLVIVGGIALGAIDAGLAVLGGGAAILFVAFATLGPIIAGPAARLSGVPVTAWRGVTGRLGAENARRNPKRTAITGVALAIGVALVVVVSVFAASIRSTVQTQAGNAFERVDFIVDGGTSFTGFSPEVAAALEARPDVERVTRVRFNPVTLLDSVKAREAVDEDPGDDIPAGEVQFSIGVDDRNFLDMVTIADLTPAVDSLAPNEVMVMADVAEANGWKVGDDIAVWFPRTGTQTWTIAATFGARVGGGSSFITNLETVEANAIDQFQADMMLYGQLTEGTDAAAAIDDITDELAVLSPAAAVSTVSDYLDEQLALLDSIVNMIYVLLALSIVIALVGVANTISLSIHERTRELGLLRAIGMTRTQVFEAITWESAIIALIGTVGGLSLGIWLAIVFIGAIDEEGLSPVVEPGTVVTIAVIGALAGVIAAVRPARRATKTDVLGAIATI